MTDNQEYDVEMAKQDTIQEKNNENFWLIFWAIVFGTVTLCTIFSQ